MRPSFPLPLNIHGDTKLLVALSVFDMIETAMPMTDGYCQSIGEAKMRLALSGGFRVLSQGLDRFLTKSKDLIG